MAQFRWTSRREQAALLVAQGDLTNEEIGARVGVSLQTVNRWKGHPDFRERVESLLAEFRATILAEGIADTAQRVKRLDDHWKRMQRVIEERAADPSMAGVPGGRSGLLVRQVKAVKVYEAPDGIDDDLMDCTPVRASRLVEEHAVDTGLLKELREYEKQAAQELGQWTEKRELTGKGGGPLEVEVDDARERLIARLAALAERRREAGGDRQPEPGGSGEAAL